MHHADHATHMLHCGCFGAHRKGRAGRNTFTVHQPGPSKKFTLGMMLMDRGSHVLWLECVPVCVLREALNGAHA